MNHKQTKQLAQILTQAREQHGMSLRQLADRSGIPKSSISRWEQGDVPDIPSQQTIQALADALDLDLADLYSTISYLQPKALPSFTPYLRSKYADLPDAARSELQTAFDRIAKKHGHDAAGPQPGEDEK